MFLPPKCLKSGACHFPFKYAKICLLEKMSDTGVFNSVVELYKRQVLTIHCRVRPISMQNAPCIPL